MGFFAWAGTIIVGIVIGKLIFDQVIVFLKTRELREIDDCPFKFVVKGEHIIFTLDKNTTLWCEYCFGIRSDGIYGLSEIELRGINGAGGSIANLKIGQSVFPMIKAMDEFLSWSKLKPFDTKIRDGFEGEWKAMKKKLDNLRYLESEEQKKEKKSK